MATIKQIAESCGLSSATVSRVLRNDPEISISAEARIRIQQAVDELGIPTMYKKAASCEINIGIIHKQTTFRNQIDSAYYFALRSGIEEYCTTRKIGFTFIPFVQISENQKSLDGYIIVGNYSYADFSQIVSKFKPAPIVCIGIVSYFPSLVDNISFSNKKSVTMALDYLVQNGHKRIGYIGIIEAKGTLVSRRQTFIDFMTGLGTYDERWVRESSHGDDRVKQGYMLMKVFLSENRELPTAFFCANDPVALGALSALRECGVKVPDDISLISHDSIFSTQYSAPALTTIDVHPYEQGKEGIKALMERIRKERTIAKTVLLEPELLVRDSVRNIGGKQPGN